MKIWIDVLTPKQLLFAEQIMKGLKRGNSVFVTSRDYRELNELIKIRKIHTRVFGKHGGKERADKLLSSTQRIEKLTKFIQKSKPDIAISFQSPEAARVAFGLGIKHFGFADSAHASAVMKLTIPFLDKLFIPWFMPKKNFSRYGISKENIIQYRAHDAAIISKRDFSKQYQIKKQNKIIILRMAEDYASYNDFSNNQIIPIIKNILKNCKNVDLYVSPRYVEQIKFLRKKFGKKIKIFEKIFDSKDFLRYADVFLGSGGTMTAEAAFLNIPTISYNKRDDYEGDTFLVKKGIVIREYSPTKIPKIINNLFHSDLQKSKVEKILKEMQDPSLILKKHLKILIHTN